MKHLGIRSDAKLELGPEREGKYRHTRTVKCSKCEVSYGLCSPELEMEAAIVEKQAQWLSQYITSRCPEHPAEIITPDLL